MSAVLSITVPCYMSKVNCDIPILPGTSELLKYKDLVVMNEVLLASMNSL